MSTISRYNRKKKKKGFFLQVLISTSIMILLATGLYVGYTAYQAYTALNKAQEKIIRPGNKSEIRETPVDISTNPISFLIMGIEDYADGGPGRTDTLLVATFNPANQSMKLASIPRDTRVEIPDTKNKTKINAAYALGEKELTIKTVEKLLNIPIDYYVSVKFDGFVNIVDAVGGVDVNVPFNFNDINRKWKRFYFKKGPMHLNGDAALVYARMRKKDPNGDFGRNDRQQQVIRGVIDQLSSPSIIFKIDNVIEEIGNNIKTNMSVSEAIAFKQKYSNFTSKNIQTVKFVVTDDMRKENGHHVYYAKADEKKLIELSNELRQHLGLPAETLSNEETNDSNDSTGTNAETPKKK